MKYIKHILPIFTMAMLVLACDVIDGPYMETSHPNGNNDKFQKIVLLEEFTGHQCSNCPAAANLAAQLHTLYGSQFLIISYHSGWFARTSTNFPTNYTTATGDELYSHFNVQSNPAGVINRINSNGYIVSSTDWGTTAAQQLTEEPTIGLKVEAEYTPTNRSIGLNIDVTAIGTIANPIYICAYISESGLITPQSTSEVATYPTGVIANYEHKHVFRQSLNGTWGEIVAQTMTNAQVKSIKINGTLGNGFEADNCQIVVFAYNKTSGEILQAVAKNL